MDPQFQKTKDELDQLTAELQKQVAEMKKNLSKLERWNKPGVEELIEQGHTWEPWYAWRPAKDIHGNWHWRKNIYRMRGNTYVDYDNWAWYHYGTVFDVIRTTGK